MSTRKKGNRPQTKAQLRVGLKNLERQLLNTQANLQTLETQEQLRQRREAEMRADRERESAMVQRIVRLIQYHQPTSALLPPSLQPTQAAEFPASYDRMMPPPDWTLKFAGDGQTMLDPISPIILHDLEMVLETRPMEWTRLVMIKVKDKHLHLKISEEVLATLNSGGRRCFVREIAEQIGAALFQSLWPKETR